MAGMPGSLDFGDHGGMAREAGAIPSVRSLPSEICGGGCGDDGGDKDTLRVELFSF